MGALERLNLALKILSGRYAPTRSEIENLKSSLRVDAGPMSAEELASEVIHHELSRQGAQRQTDKVVIEFTPRVSGTRWRKIWMKQGAIEATK